MLLRQVIAYSLPEASIKSTFAQCHTTVEALFRSTRIERLILGPNIVRRVQSESIRDESVPLDKLISPIFPQRIHTLSMEVVNVHVLDAICFGAENVFDR